MYAFLHRTNHRRVQNPAVRYLFRGLNQDLITLQNEFVVFLSIKTMTASIHCLSSNLVVLYPTSDDCLHICLCAKSTLPLPGLRTGRGKKKMDSEQGIATPIHHSKKAGWCWKKGTKRAQRAPNRPRMNPHAHGEGTEKSKLSTIGEEEKHKRINKLEESIIVSEAGPGICPLSMPKCSMTKFSVMKFLVM